LLSCNGVFLGSLSKGQTDDSAMVQGKDCWVGAGTLYIRDALNGVQNCVAWHFHGIATLTFSF
jgi:hypothetical protein